MALDERILTAFKLTGNDTDFVCNENMRIFGIECGCSLKKVKETIVAMNSKVHEGKHKEGTHQFKGLRGLCEVE